MGRSPCCEKVGLKKGPWTPDEDKKLLAYIEEHGHGNWRSLPAKAGLQRCGKSCRLRWTNYLKPDIKRGKFSLQEEQTIIQLHALLGNRWSAIATHLPKRTDNEIKNHWNTHLKKRLTKMGIDPVTHKPKTDALSSGDGQPGNSANLIHSAQWESARLEAEARLAKEAKLRSTSNSPQPSSPQPASPVPQQQEQQQEQQQSMPRTSALKVTTSASSSLSKAQLLNRMATQSGTKSLCQQQSQTPGSLPRVPASSLLSAAQLLNKMARQPAAKALCQQLRPSSSARAAQLLNKLATQPAAKALCLDVLRAWQGFQTHSVISGSNPGLGSNHHVESPTSTLNFSDNSMPKPCVGHGENSNTSSNCGEEILREEGSDEDVWKGYEKCLDDFEFNLDDQWPFESLKIGAEQEPVLNSFDGFTDLLLGDHSDIDIDEHHFLNGSGRESNNVEGTGGDDNDFEQNKDYWNNMFDLLNASPSESPVLLETNDVAM